MDLFKYHSAKFKTNCFQFEYISSPIWKLNALEKYHTSNVQKVWIYTVITPLRSYAKSNNNLKKPPNAQHCEVWSCGNNILLKFLLDDEMIGHSR